MSIKAPKDTKDILPDEIQNSYTAWCNSSPLIEKVASSKLITGQCPCLFFCKFQIPWFWRWNITISKDRFNVPILQRNFFDKFILCIFFYFIYIKCIR